MARSPRLAATLLCASAALALGCDHPRGDPGPDVRVRLDRVVIDDHDTPVMVLEEEGGPRWLPIWIGIAEAHSIALQIEERRLPRPNTHDLARSVIRGMHGRVVRVVVTELRDGTYYAVLGLDVGGEPVEVDARPSDAVAIALRDGAPIYVREDLFRVEADSSELTPSEDPDPPPEHAI